MYALTPKKVKDGMASKATGLCSLISLEEQFKLPSTAPKKHHIIIKENNNKKMAILENT